MAGKITEKDIDTVRRRVASMVSHVFPVNSLSTSFVGVDLVNTSSINDSYHRTHGRVSDQPVVWRTDCDELGKEFTDIIYEKSVGEGIAKITINRPERRNAFRPQTIKEMIRAFDNARDDSSIGVIILTGKGTEAFCSGGDQNLRKSDGYVDYDNFGRLNVLDLQVQIRRLPKPVIAMVAGYAVGGGHVLHMVCDITIAAENAIFGQTGPKVGSFDAGYGSSIMSRLVGPKKAREIWFMARFYSALEAEKMGLINTIVPLENLEQETIKWCREMLRNSPTAIRVLKSALNAVDDGHAGLQRCCCGGCDSPARVRRRAIYGRPKGPPPPRHHRPRSCGCRGTSTSASSPASDSSRRPGSPDTGRSVALDRELVGRPLSAETGLGFEHYLPKYVLSWRPRLSWGLHCVRPRSRWSSSGPLSGGLRGGRFLRFVKFVGG